MSTKVVGKVTKEEGDEILKIKNDAEAIQLTVELTMEALLKGARAHYAEVAERRRDWWKKIQQRFNVANEGLRLSINHDTLEVSLDSPAAEPATQSANNLE